MANSSYSYTFTGKTISQIQTDWWTTAQWTPTITSNWYSSSNSSRARSNFALSSLSNAKKITLKTTIVFTSTASWTACRLFTSSRTNATWYLISTNWDRQIQIWWDVTTLSAIWTTGTFETISEFDLENATYKFSLTWFSDITWTLTSTQISNIRNCTVSEAFSEDNNGALSSISLTIEEAVQQPWIYVWSTNIWNGKIWYGNQGSSSTDSYTISNVPNDNTNQYISIAKSWYVVNSVVFEFTSVWTSNTPNDCYFRISSTNSSVNRYWWWIQYRDDWTTRNRFAVIWRLNNNSDTQFRENFSLISDSWTNTVRLAFDRNGWSYTINWTTTTRTHGTSEKNMVETIMNSSTINAYASRQGWATIAPLNISVTYETEVSSKAVTSVYLWSTKVRPAWVTPWTPWSNTLLYMPLDSNLRDLSSYNRTASITNGTISYDTIWWVNCAYPSSNGRINIPMTDFNNLSYTESIWLYATWNTYWKFIWGNKNSSWSYIDVTFVTNDSNGNKRANYFGGDHFSNTAYTTWAWKLITVTRSWNTVKMYQDGVQFYTYSYSNPYAFASIDLFSRSDYWQQRPWYAADFVVEKVCWTDAEVLNYYNQTKSKYENTTTTYNADLSTFNLMTTYWWGTPTYSNWIIKTTGEWWIAYKDVSWELDVNNAKKIVMECDYYPVWKTWATTARVYLDNWVCNNKGQSQSWYSIGQWILTQTASWYNTGTLVTFCWKSYGSATAWTEITYNTRHHLYAEFDIQNATWLCKVDDVQKGSWTIDSENITNYHNMTYSYINMYIETNNQIKNLSIQVTK